MRRTGLRTDIGDNGVAQHTRSNLAAGLLFAGLLYTALTVIYTWPLLLSFNTALFGIWGGKYGGDLFGNIYTYWLAEHLWNNGLPLFQNPLVAFPFSVGGAQAFGLHLPAEVIQGTLLTMLVNEFFAYNTLVVASFILSGLATFLLVHHITGNRAAAIIAGIIFAFSPYRLYVSVGWIELSQTQWIPLYFFCLIKANEEKTLLWGVAAGLVLALIFLTVHYYSYFMGTMTVLFICFKVVRDLWARTRFDTRFFKVFIAGMVLAGAIVFGGLSGFFSDDSVFSNPYDIYKIGGLVVRSARPLDFLLPSVDHPVFGGLVGNFLDSRAPLTHNVMDIFIGYTALFLAFYGTIRWFRNRGVEHKADFSTGLFVAMVAVALLLSFPPYVKVGSTTLYLPSYAMYFVAPMFKSLARYGVVVMCALSVLAGIGATYLLNARSGWRRLSLIVVIVLLILFEFQNTNTGLATQTHEVPEVYNWLATEPGNGAIAEYPAFTRLDYRSFGYLFFQRIHKKPMMNGTPERSREDAIRITIADITAPDVPEMLDFLGVRRVVVHESYYTGAESAPPVAIDGLKLLKRFGRDRVYEVVAESNEFMIIPYGNFHPVERAKDGEAWRWLRDSGHINFFNANEEAVPVTVGFSARAFEETRWLNIKHEQRLMQVQIPADETLLHRFETVLQPGSNFIRLYTDSTPAQMTGSAGVKEVSIYIGGLRVESTDGVFTESRN